LSSTSQYSDKKDVVHLPENSCKKIKPIFALMLSENTVLGESYALLNPESSI